MPRSASDRRVRRTQDALRAALAELIVEKGYDAVTVNDLARRAGVARSTFYLHHGDKQSLFLSGIRPLREELQREQRRAFALARGGAPLAFSRAFFEHVGGHRALYRALGARSSALALDRIRDLLTRLVTAEFSRRSRAASAAGVPRAAAIRFVVDAFVSIVLWWVEENSDVTAPDADAVFRRLIVPAVNAAGSGLV